MEKSERITLTNMCMIENNGKVLVQRRTNTSWDGLCFPGGHVEDGESLADSVIREINEETGLTVSDLKLCGIKEWIYRDSYRYMVMVYKTDKFEGQPRSSSEGEVFWMDLDEFLHSPEMCDGMDDTVEMIKGGNFSEICIRQKKDDNWAVSFK